MSIEYRVLIDYGDIQKSGFLSKKSENDILSGRLASPGDYFLLADMGYYKGNKFLHLAEIMDEGKAGLLWLEQIRHCRHSEETVYGGYFNIARIPNLSEHTFRSIFMDAPRYKNGKAIVYLTLLGIH